MPAALALFDDEDYRSALVWAAEKYLDVTLAIDGALEIDAGQEANQNGAGEEAGEEPSSRNTGEPGV